MANPYGQSMATPIAAGVPAVFLTQFSLEMVSSDKYNGPALQLGWKNQQGHTRQDRLFPVNPIRMRETYKQHQSKFGDTTEEQFVSNAFQQFSWQIEQLLKAYVPHEKVTMFLSAQQDTVISGDPTNSISASAEAFVAFVSGAKALLEQECANYSTELRYITLGYAKNSTYPSLPNSPSQGLLISTDPITFKVSKGYKPQPHGPNIEAAAANAGAQQTNSDLTF